MKSHPPKPKLTLTVGITGHRLHRPPLPGEGNGAVSSTVSAVDVSKVRTAIDGVLKLLTTTLALMHGRFASSFDETAPTLTMISSLAEGSDRIAAQAALDLKMPLDVVLPCPRLRYEKSFEDDASRQEFARLLGQARATLVLPLPEDAKTSDTASLDHAYELGGLTVLAQSDILIAVWDGRPARGRGGTAEIVDEAARQGTPIVVIDPKDGEPHLRWSGSLPLPVPARHALDLPVVPLASGLERIILKLVEPPASSHETEGMRIFFDTLLENRFQHVGWRLLRRATGLDRHTAQKKQETVPESLNPGAETETNRLAAARLRGVSRAASVAADHHANAFRTAFVINFLLGAAAVLFVALSILIRPFDVADGYEKEVHAFLVVAELTCVLIVVGYVLVASREQWHRRWFEAREVAERLRVAGPFWMLGVWPHNLSALQPAWTGWYMRAILREQPVFSGDLGTSLPTAKNILKALITGQIRYHSQNVHDMEHLDSRLNIVGVICLAVTLIGGITIILATVILPGGLPDRLEAALTALAVFLPALATALYGIRLIGDFDDSVRRSNRTLAALTALERGLETVASNLPVLRACARQTADVMLADVEAWRVAVESRDLGAA
jgi:hypothetical protein